MGSSEHSLEVGVPVETLYAAWADPDLLPRSLGAVRRVRRLGERHLLLDVELAGLTLLVEVELTTQRPPEELAWRAVRGARHRGRARFERRGPSRSALHLHVEYEPSGIVERLIDRLGILQRALDAELARLRRRVETHHAEAARRGHGPSRRPRFS